MTDPQMPDHIGRFVAPTRQSWDSNAAGGPGEGPHIGKPLGELLGQSLSDPVGVSNAGVGPDPALDFDA